MRRTVQVIAALGAVGTLLILAPATALAVPARPADVSDFSFESFTGEYHLDVDEQGRATTRVVETIVAVFPEFDQNRGIIRAIPLRDGEVPLDLTMVSVTDENGDPVYWERNDYDGFAEFALGTDEFVRGRTTYVLEYTMRDTIRHFSDSGGDEFYWDVNGDGWGQEFGTVSARVILSDRLVAALTGDASCYVGSFGETGSCELDRTEDGFGVSVGPVGPYSTLTVAIGFDGDTVVQPELARDSWIVRLAPGLLLAGQGLLALVALLLRTIGWRDARGRGTIIAQYTPPEKGDLLLDANLLGRREAGLPAMLVDFAVRGIVQVIDTRPGISVGADRTKYALRLVDPEGADARETAVLVMLFGAELAPDTQVNPGKLSSGKAASLYGLASSTASFAHDEGYRAVPGGRSAVWIRRVALVLLLAYVPVGIWAAVNGVFGDGVLGFAFGSIAAAIGTSIILIRPSRLTRAGAEAKEYLLGLREYLTVAEEDRLRMLQSPEGALRVDVTDHDAVVKLNERLLGYAVLWGVEDRWAEQLSTQYAGASPAWVDGSFDAGMLRSLTRATMTSVRPLVSSSSSSSSWSSSGSSSFSSGSSGGGFSGGGGGGGGGGGR